MIYTEFDEDKQYGVKIAGKLAQKGSNDYKLIEARDIDWNGAKASDGTTIRTSDDLIDWIATKAATTTPGGSGQSGVKAVTITVYKNLQTPMDVTKPTITGAYNFDSGNVDKLNGLQEQGWYLSSCFEKTMYVYSSTNTYTKFNDVIIESGWSDPVRFYNVEDITQSAAERAKEYYDQIIDGDGETLKGLVERATETLAEAESLIADAQADSSELATSIQAARDLIASIQDGGTDTEKLLFTVNELKAQMQAYGWHVGATATFTWLGITFRADTDREYSLSDFGGTDFYEYDSYGIKVRCVKYGNVYESATDNRDKYILQLTSIDATKLHPYDGQLFENSFSSNVNLLCLSRNAQPGELLIDGMSSILGHLNNYPLFSDSAVSNKVTYTKQLTDAVKSVITSEVKTVDITNNTHFKSYASQTARDITNLVAKVNQKTNTADFTEWTQNADGIYAKASKVNTLDNTVQQGFQEIKNDLVSTGVYEKDQDGNYKYSGINIAKDYVKLASNGTLVTVDGQGVDISNNLIVSGDIISDAIATDGIQVADKTSITKYGDLTVGIGTAGETKFNNDGSGYIANGLLSWGDGKVNGIASGCSFSGTVASKLYDVTYNDMYTKQGGFDIKDPINDDTVSINHIVDIQYTGNQIHLNLSTAGQPEGSTDSNSSSKYLIDLPSFASGFTIDGDTGEQYARGIVGQDDLISYRTWAAGFIGTTLILYVDSLDVSRLYFRGILNIPCTGEVVTEYDIKELYKPIDIKTIEESLPGSSTIVLQCKMGSYKLDEQMSAQPAVYWEIVSAGPNYISNQMGSLVKTCESKNTTHYID